MPSTSSLSDIDMCEATRQGWLEPGLSDPSNSVTTLVG